MQLQAFCMWTLNPFFKLLSMSQLSHTKLPPSCSAVFVYLLCIPRRDVLTGADVLVNSFAGRPSADGLCLYILEIYLADGLMQTSVCSVVIFRLFSQIILLNLGFIANFVSWHEMIITRWFCSNLSCLSPLLTVVISISPTWTRIGRTFILIRTNILNDTKKPLSAHTYLP